MYKNIRKHDLLAQDNELNTTFDIYSVALWSVVHSRTKGKRKESDSYNKNIYIHRKIQKAMWQHKNATKTSITNDCGPT